MKVVFHGIDPSKLQATTLTVPAPSQITSISSLIEHLTERHGMGEFFKEKALPPGMFCIINGVDSECGDGGVKDEDEVVFINSLHGG